MTVVPFPRAAVADGRSPLGMVPGGSGVCPGRPPEPRLVLELPPLAPWPLGLWQAAAITTGVLWLRACGVGTIIPRVKP